MKRDLPLAILAVNFVGLLVLAAVTLLRTPATPGPGAASAPPAASAPGGVEAELEALRARVAALEASAAPAASASAAAPARLARASEPGAGPGGPRDEAAPLTAPDAQAPVTRADVESIVASRLAARDAKWKQAQQDWAKRSKREKKLLPDVARELGLDATQETAIRGLYRETGREMMKVLFEIGDDQLEQLKAQLSQAEHDPALKEQLRQQVAINWTKHQTKFSVLFIKLDAKLRKVLPQKTLASFYRFDVKLKDPEFPDLEAMFQPKREQD